MTRPKTGKAGRVGCDCIHYESADEDDPQYGTCVCNHAPEEHGRDGCEGEVEP